MHEHIHDDTIAGGDQPCYSAKAGTPSVRKNMRLLYFKRFSYFFPEPGCQCVLPAQYRGTSGIDPILIYAVFGSLYDFGVVAEPQIVLRSEIDASHVLIRPGI